MNARPQGASVVPTTPVATIRASRVSGIRGTTRPCAAALSATTRTGGVCGDRRLTGGAGGGPGRRGGGGRGGGAGPDAGGGGRGAEPLESGPERRHVVPAPQLLGERVEHQGICAK